MIPVRYLIAFADDDRHSVLSGDAHAVLASDYAEYDIGQGGITREEVREEDVADLITFPANSELFVESPLESDCLDNSTDQTAALTRIWWRVIITEREPI